MRSIKIQEFIGALTITLLCFLIFISSSPLNDNITSDYGIFSIMGQAWKNGFIPFRDIFDQKGILFVFTYYIGQIISGDKVGIFIIQVVNFSITLLLLLSIIKSIDSNISKRVQYLTLLICMVFFLLVVEAGALTEEFSLIFILLPIYLIFKFLSQNSSMKEHPFYYSVIYGACFAAIALIRVNNAALNAGFVIGFIILFIQERDYKYLLYNALFYLLGMAIISLPFMVYLYANDALYEMIYANYTYNWHYKDNWHVLTNAILINNCKLLLPCLYLAIVTPFYDKKYQTKYSYFLVPSSLLCIYFFYGSAGYLHYFVNVLPFFFISIILSYRLAKRKKRYTIIITSLLLCSTISSKSINLICSNGIQNIQYFMPEFTDYIYSKFNQESFKYKFDKRYNEQAKILSFIPLQERNSIYSYNTFPFQEIFIHNNITPIGKYFWLNEVVSKVHSKTKEEMDIFHAKAEAEWVLTTEFEKEGSFATMLEQYELIYTTVDHSTTVYLYNKR